MIESSELILIEDKIARGLSGYDIETKLSLIDYLGISPNSVLASLAFLYKSEKGLPDLTDIDERLLESGYDKYILIELLCIVNQLELDQHLGQNIKSLIYEKSPKEVVQRLLNVEGINLKSASFELLRILSEIPGYKEEISQIIKHILVKLQQNQNEFQKMSFGAILDDIKVRPGGYFKGLISKISSNILSKEDFLGLIGELGNPSGVKGISYALIDEIEKFYKKDFYVKVFCYLLFMVGLSYFGSIISLAFDEEKERLFMQFFPSGITSLILGLMLYKDKMMSNRYIGSLKEKFN